MNKLINIIVFSLLTMISFGQEVQEDELIEIKGKLIDATNNNYLPYAHIYNKTNRQGTTSDSYGYFKLNVRKTDTLRISFVGYKNLIISNLEMEISNEETVIFKLQPEIYTLSEVIIHPLGTYEQFKWNIINLELPETEEERVHREINALAKLAIDKVKYNRPKCYGINDFKASAGFDVTGLTGVYKRLKEAENDHQKDLQIAKIYNKEILKKVSGFEGENLDSFMVFCNQNLNFDYLSSEFDLYIRLYQLLNDFNSERDTV